MAINTLKLKLTLDADGFKAESQGVLTNATTLALGFNQVTQAVQTVINTAGDLAEPFMTAQSQMAEVESLGVPNIEALNSAIQDLGQDVAVPLDNLRGGLYDVVSAGVDSANQIAVLESSAKAAKAGLAETSDALNLGSAVIKGYGKDWGEFNSVMDMAFQTVKLGQTTFPELASSVGLVTPLASSLKIETQELFGAMATLTGVTGGASEVATQLRAIMTSLADPTDEMAELVKSYGYESTEAAAKNEGLQGIMKMLQEATGGSAAEMTKYFGRIEATNAALALSTAQHETFISKTAAMQDSVGAMGDAFAVQNETLESQVQILENQWNVVLEKSMAVLVPFASGLLEVAGAAVDTRSEMAKFRDEMDEVNANLQDLSNVDTLISRYEDLTSKGLNRTTEETAELESITAKLAATYPDAVSAINEFGEATAINSQKVKLMADQQRAMWESQNSKLIDEQNEKLKSFIDVLDDGAEQVNELIPAMDKLRAEYKVEQLEIMTAAHDRLVEKLAGANENINNQIAIISKWVDVSDPDAVKAFADAQGYTADQFETLQQRIESYLETLGGADDEPVVVDVEPVITETPQNLPPIAVPIKPVMDVSADDTSEMDFFGDIDQQPFIDRYQAELDSYKLLLNAKQIGDEEYQAWRLELYDTMAQEALATYGADSDAYLTALSQKFAAEAEHANKLKALEKSKLSTEQAVDAARVKSIQGTFDAAAGAANTWFGQNKGIATAIATMDTYQAITKALASAPPPWNFVQAALVGAQGWANVANIQSQDIPKMALGGPLDSSGRVVASGNYGGGENRMFIGNDGEFIVNADAYRQNMDLVNSINDGINYRPALSGGQNLDSAVIGDMIGERVERAMENIQITIRSELDAMQFFRDNEPKYAKDKAARTLS